MTYTAAAAICYHLVYAGTESVNGCPLAGNVSSLEFSRNRRSSPKTTRLCKRRAGSGSPEVFVSKNNKQNNANILKEKNNKKQQKCQSFAAKKKKKIMTHY